jgi:class 3 adenylate cyclase/DNA-binding CsgD family transcriptional regulator/tetratricopeptide (TPR) repeat protein
LGDSNPEGIVTVLFTDVEGSTALRSDKGDRIAQQAFDAHDEIVRSEVAAHRGRIVKGLGDGFMIVFATPADGLGCARAIQQSLERERRRNPDSTVRVRMGLNTGEVVRQGDDLQGIAVNAAARIAAKAKGGQILASEVVRQLTSANPEYGMTALGWFSLKGFTERWRLYEMPWEGDERAMAVVAPAPGAVRPARVAPGGPPASAGLASEPDVGPVLCPVVIGRADELAALDAALAAGADGQGGAVLLLGEAGVGKSRLTREAAGRADERGWVVLSGRAVPSASPVAFRPLAEALLSALRATGLPDDPELVPFRAALGRLVPQWREAGSADAAESIVVVAEGVLRLLRCLSQGAGCLLLLEDLQWADPETLAIVEYLADNLPYEPVVCLVTVRTEEASAAMTLARSLRARRAGRVLELGRLGPSDIDRMAEACLGSGGVPKEAVDALLGWADGIPFFVEELLASWVSGGTLVPGPGGWAVAKPIEAAVPLTFADTVQGRLAPLGGAAQSLLQAAAVVGRRFDWTLLPLITGQPETIVLDVLSQAVAAQLVAPDPGGAGFKFRHSLTRDAIADTLLPPQRQALSRSARRAVEDAHPGLPGEWCELAADLALAAGDTGDAADLLLDAGRRAMDQGALGSAEAVLRRARGLAGVAPAVVNEIDDALCDTLALAGHADAAAAVGAALLDRLRLEGAPAEFRARVHLRLARAAVAAAQWDRADEHLAAVAELSPRGTEPEVDAHLAALSAHVAIGRGEYERAYGLAEAAVAEAEAAGQPAQVCEALEVLGRCLRRSDLAAAEAVFERARAVAAAHDLTVWSVRAAAELGLIDQLAGKPIDRLKEAARLARAAGALGTVASLDLQSGFWYYDRHSLDEALEAFQRCADATGRFRLDELGAVAASGRALVHVARGDRPATEEALEEADRLSGRSPVILEMAATTRAFEALQQDDLARGISHLDQAREAGRSYGGLPAPHSGWWALLRTFTASDGAGARADVLASTAGPRPVNQAYLAYAEAIEAGRAGDPDRAASLVASADPHLASFPLFHHHARRLVAEAAIDDGWGDPVAWLRAALAFFEADKTEAMTRTCRSLLARAGDPTVRRHKAPEGLSEDLVALGVTRRELDVLQLLADGRPTKEIAERLYLSPKTVERHISNLATKVGVAGRAQLVAFAAAWAARTPQP